MTYIPNKSKFIILYQIPFLDQVTNRTTPASNNAALAFIPPQEEYDVATHVRIVQLTIPTSAAKFDVIYVQPPATDCLPPNNFNVSTNIDQSGITLKYFYKLHQM